MPGSPEIHENYIVNGFPAYEGQFPWHCSILRRDNHDESLFHVAGGSIVSANWILTAGHVAKPLHQYRLRFNSLSLWSGGSIIDASHAVVHPEYNETTLQNNLALIRLPSALDLSEGSPLQAVRLPCWVGVDDVRSSWVGERARTAGHGLTTKEKHSEVLNFVDLSIIDNFSCRNYFGSRVDENVLCAVGWSNRNQNTCGGDSGGALLTRDVNGWVQTGITSFGALNACDQGFPSGYTRVQGFSVWISETAGLNLETECGPIPDPDPEVGIDGPEGPELPGPDFPGPPFP